MTRTAFSFLCTLGPFLCSFSFIIGNVLLASLYTQSFFHWWRNHLVWSSSHIARFGFEHWTRSVQSECGLSSIVAGLAKKQQQPLKQWFGQSVEANYGLGQSVKPTCVNSSLLFLIQPGQNFSLWIEQISLTSKYNSSQPSKEATFDVAIPLTDLEWEEAAAVRIRKQEDTMN